ncbi:hypothetical protein N4R57_07035 [Rhodobacteraceae bacterium D3-12]|nr:hypothetical protein N4R57_07035 [Rhodobacteraceae bacterium D3-12]
MSNFDYNTNIAKPRAAGEGNGFGLLLVVAIVVALLALFSIIGGGTTPAGPDGAGDVAPVTDAPATSAPAASAPAAGD